MGLLVALAGMLVVRVLGLAYALPRASEAPIGAAPGFLGTMPGGDSLLLLAATAAVIWCTTPIGGEAGAEPTNTQPAPSPHAYAVAVAGLVVVGLTVAGWVTFAGWDLVAVLASPEPRAQVSVLLGVVDAVLRLAVPLAALVAVLIAVRRAAAARVGEGERAALDGAGSVPETPPVAPTPERLPAAWQPEEATGAVWLTADDAAQGRPGLSWTGPSDAPGGWAPEAERDPPAPDASEDDDLR